MSACHGAHITRSAPLHPPLPWPDGSAGTWEDEDLSEHRLDEVAARLRAAGSVFAEDEAALLLAAAEDRGALEELVARRAAGAPLAHVLGWTDFLGLRVRVDPGVFVPRPRSEWLARQAVRHTRAGALVLDLCCGSGALGMAVAAGVPGVTLHAADLDEAAVACARRNLAPFGGRVHHGDLFAPLPTALRGRVDVLIANVPYVPAAAVATMPVDVREHEPRLALDGGADGLDVLRRVAAEAGEWLRAGGVLLTETAAAQAEAACAVLEGHGLRARVRRDAAHDATVVRGRRVRT